MNIEKKSEALKYREVFTFIVSQNVSHYDAYSIIKHVLKMDMLEYHMSANSEISQENMDEIVRLLEKISHSFPLAYVLRQKHFYNTCFIVEDGVLIPRQDTECIVHRILSENRATCDLLDLGTGCGAIGLSIAKEKPTWKILATDISPQALLVAGKNLEEMALKNVDLLHSSWFENIDSKFDIIVSNPPYVSRTDFIDASIMYEPEDALYAEDDGFSCLKTIVDQSQNYLKVGGMLVVEHGCDQGDRVKKMFLDQGYEKEEKVYDLENRHRGTLGYKM